MSSHPWMPLYVGDYLAKTQHLSIAQSGAYLHLIFHYWQHGGLPDDDHQLAQITRCRVEDWRRRYRPAMVLFFQPGWRHPRIDQELAHAAELSENRRKAGISSGASRRKKPPKRNKCSFLNEQVFTQSQSHSPLAERKSSEACASEPDGSPGRPVYTDTRHELWAEGTAILTSLGVPEKSARPNIGRWLKAAGDNAETVLGAIQRARDARAVEPVAWITQAIKPKANGIRHAQEDRSVLAAADRLVDLIHGFDADLAGTGRH